MISKSKFFDAVGYKPHKGQIQIHGALEMPTTRAVIAICGVRFGKSKAAAHEMAYEAVRPRKKTPVNPKGEFMGWIVSFDHASAKVVFGMVYEILREFLKGHVNKNESEGIITFTNMNGAKGTIMRRTTQDAGGKGKLTSYAVDFLVVDEAAKITQGIDIWENQLSTRLIDRGGRSLHISTPMGVEGYCAELYRRGLEAEEGLISVKLPTWLNPYIPKEEIRRAKRQLRGKAFDQEYGAELLANSGMVFNRDDLLGICKAAREEDPIEGMEYFGGLDLGMTNDPTVLTIAREPLKGEFPPVPRVVYIERFHRMHIDVMLHRVKVACDKYNGASLNVDESGIGKPIFQQMLGLEMSVRGITITGSGQHSKLNLISHAMTVVEKGRMMLPESLLIPVYVKELLSYQWETTPSGKQTANAPEGSHDDCVWSFILTCWWLPPTDGTLSGQVWHRGMTKVKHVPDAGRPQRPEMKLSGDADPEDAEALVHNQQARSQRMSSLWGNPLVTRGQRR